MNTAVRNYSIVGPERAHAIESGLVDAQWYTSPLEREQLRILMQRRDGPFRILDVWWSLPFLEVLQDPGWPSATFRLDVRLLPEWLLPGAVDGTIHVLTDDPRWPEVLIPVHAELW